jgi:outer membrane protein assembly factor BamD (BamD/ComL family)
MSSDRTLILCDRHALAVMACVLVLSGCSSFTRVGEEPGPGYGLVRPPASQEEAGSLDPPLASREEELDWLDQLTSTIESITDPGEDHALARRLFREAEQHYNRSAQWRGDAVSQEQLQRAGESYLKAARLYGRAADNWSDSALQEDARYMAGESYFFIDYYDKANESYEKMLDDYPNSRYMDVVQQRRFTIADFWLKDAERNSRPFLFFNLTNESFPLRDNREEAIRIFDKIRLQDPTGKIADDATMAAALALIKQQEYERADVFLTDLRKTFASSEHQFMAHYLGIHTKLRGYKGAWYSGVVLDEAEKLVQRIRRQFPREERKYSQDVNRMHAEVRFLKAEREWAMAQFYDRRDEIGAARIYYTSILHTYPDTPFAERAIGRLKEVENMPAKPPQYLTWLVNLFPVEEPARPLFNSNDAGTYEP